MDVDSESNSIAANHDHASPMDESSEETNAKVLLMIEACAEGNSDVVQHMLTQPGPIVATGNGEATFYFAAQQDVTTGRSPLMAAAHGGHVELCQLLLDHGAPWNALDRYGQCAGDYAVAAQNWPIVNLLVDWGTKAELILSAATRWQRKQQQQATESGHLNNDSFAIQRPNTSPRPVEQEPCTKPDYLRQQLHFRGKDNSALVDQDGDAVMMEWERPLMELHASTLLDPASNRKSVLNVGFGLGLIDSALQKHHPTLHIIIEAHPQVYQRMLDEQWDKKPGVRIEFGTWQTVVPRLIEQGVLVDAVFYDTYGEHFLDLEDFHGLLPQLLSNPHGMYSFFNGLAPDNIFFHGVACNCVKLQLEQLGLQAEFWQCEMQGVIQPHVWDGIRRKYWHDDRDTYYLPVVTWNDSLLTSGNVGPSLPNPESSIATDMVDPSPRKIKATSQVPMIDDESVRDGQPCQAISGNSKRLRL